MQNVDPSSVSNFLLRSLPAEVLARLAPQLRVAELAMHATLHEAGNRIDTVYFPQSGWLSLIAALRNGDVAEVGLIGCEGMVGLPLVFGTDRGPLDAYVQAPGSALQMSAGDFGSALEAHAPLRRLTLRYAMAFNAQVSMTAACNGRHLVGQRLARWLLMAHDRAVGDEFPMTHEFLSMMLCIRRASVSVAANSLQKAGLIQYEQGRIKVMDRAGLIATACECYGIVQHEQTRLLG